MKGCINCVKYISGKCRITGKSTSFFDICVEYYKKKK